MSFSRVSKHLCLLEVRKGMTQCIVESLSLTTVFFVLTVARCADCQGLLLRYVTCGSLFNYFFFFLLLFSSVALILGSALEKQEGQGFGQQSTEGWQRFGGAWFPLHTN